MDYNHLSGGSQTSETSNQMVSVNGGTPFIQTSISYVKSRNDWYVHRGITPGYRRMIREGALLPMQYYNRREIVGEYTSQYSTFASTPSPPPNPPSTTSSSWTKQGPILLGGLSDSNIALDHGGLVTQAFPDIQPYVQVAAANLYSSGWDALTFLGELHSCVAMFRGIGKSLIALLAKGKLGDTWLQWRYGWRTLWMDILQFQEMLARVDTGRKRYKERAKGRASLTRSLQIGSWNWSTSSGIITRTDQIEISVQGMVVADIEPPRIHFNPVKTGWELVTLSFIIDWFINVGQWIDAMSFLAIQTAYSASVSSSCKITSNYTLSGVTAKPPSVITNIQLSGTTSSHEVVRAPSNIPLGFTTITRLNGLKVLDLVLIVRKLVPGLR